MVKKEAARGGKGPGPRETWNLGLLYRSPSDPRIERDLKATERRCAVFARKWRPKLAKLSLPPTLARALCDYERLCEATNGKPMHFLFLSKCLATDDKKILAAHGRAEERLTRAGNLVEFFTLAIGKMPAAAQKRAIKAPALARYRHLLDGVFRASRHQLTEAEEKLSNLLCRPGVDLWEDFVDARVSALTLRWEGKELPLEAAAAKVPSIHGHARRRQLRALVMAKLKTVAPAAEAEMNAVYAWKKAQDETRGYSRPEEATFQGYEVDRATVETLIREVERAYPLAHRYYRAKAKLLGLPKLGAADLGANVKPPRGYREWKPSFAEAASTLREVVRPVSARHLALLDRMLASGQIDAYPRKGKTGGGFCAPRRKLPTYILLNHDPSPRDFTTLAHEFGHAVHASMHGHQPVFYDGETMMSAEVASTFFERLAADAALARISNPHARLVHLLERGDGFVGLVFRQVAAHRYAEILHRRIRAESYLSAEEMARELNAALSRYLGPAVRLAPEDGYTFVWWGHLRSHFYFTPYAFGELVACALYREFRRTGKAAAFERFMSLGASARVEDIFRASGLDVRKPAIWRQGIAEFKELVLELEEAAKLAGKAEKGRKR